MRVIITLFSLSAVFASVCTPKDEDRCGSGEYWKGTGCWEVDTGASDGDADADTDIDADADIGPDASFDYNQEQWIGSSCSCQGQGCNNQMSVPLPAGGTIIDCDDVPTNWVGAVKACMQSYKGAIASKTYFANGYCVLMATACEGSPAICGSAVSGDYDAFNACPKGTVMLSSSQEIAMGGFQATIDAKTCVVGCEDGGNCRSDETDPIWNNQRAEYECVDNNGVVFCFDPRNLEGEYSAETF